MTSSPSYGASSALILMDSEDRLNLWFVNSLNTGVLGEINLAFNAPNLFPASDYQSIALEESAIVLGNQLVLMTADPSGEPIPGRVELVRFNSALNNGSIQYSEDQGVTWQTVNGVGSIGKAILADDGTIFAKGQDGVTIASIVPGPWNVVPSDAATFLNVESDPGSVLLGVYTSPSQTPIVGYEPLIGDTWVPFGDGYRYARFKNGVIDVSWIESPTAPPSSNSTREFGFFRDTPGGELTGIVNGFILGSDCYAMMPQNVYYKATANSWTAILISESEYLQALANPQKKNF